MLDGAIRSAGPGMASLMMRVIQGIVQGSEVSTGSLHDKVQGHPGRSGRAGCSAVMLPAWRVLGRPVRCVGQSALGDSCTLASSRWLLDLFRWQMAWLPASCQAQLTRQRLLCFT